jgi:microcystin-dependent protein
MFDRVEWLRAKGRKLERGDFRASNADREDALRRLEVHETMGHLDQADFPRLEAAVKFAATPNEIAKVFVDWGLPELPARSPSTERRVSSQDRVEAIGLLEKAYAEGRIEAHECAEAKEQVNEARTRSEIDAAFHGLSSPSRIAAAETASNVAEQTVKLTTRVVGEGGRRAGKAFRHGVFAIGALMIGFILLIAGIGIAALASFLLAVSLFVSAAISLVTSQSSA